MEVVSGRDMEHKAKMTARSRYVYMTVWIFGWMALFILQQWCGWGRGETDLKLTKSN